MTTQPNDELAELREELELFRTWSNEIAMLVPERYEASEGTQESCISDWITDLRSLAEPLAAELLAVDDGDKPYGEGEISVPIPADDLARERLFDAARRLGDR